MDSLPVIITKTEFFKSTYRTYTAKVPPRSFSSLSFRISGKISVSATGQTLISGPESLTFIPAGCAYDTTVLEGGEMLVMHFSLAEGSADFGDRPMTVRPQHPDVFLGLFARAVRRFQAGDQGYHAMADSYRLLAEAAQAFFPTPAPYKKLAQIREYMDKNLCDATLRVSALSEKFGTSQVYFRREFKKYYGLTPIEYIKKRRLEIACQLLRTNLYPVAEVAIRAGFDSISYFSSEFHRHFGCSPREYKAL